MSLKDLIADVNVNEICEHIETETLSEWVNAWQETSAPSAGSRWRRCGEGSGKNTTNTVEGFAVLKVLMIWGSNMKSKSTKDVSMMIYIAPNAENKAPITF